MIVYPRGNRNRLSVVQVVDYEKNEWALASRREFENTEQGKAAAIEYMVELAERHGLEFDAPGYHHFLD